jgi:peptidoglycan/LPS O-acetylase OafA/YrhL
MTTHQPTHRTATTVTRTPLIDSPAAGTRRIRTARALMAAAAASALLAAVSAVGVVAEATPETQMVETWRGYGFVVFAGLFALLAINPLRYRGVWELVLAQKVALTLTAIGYSTAGDAEGTATVIVWDGALSAVVAIAYLACRGWTAGPRHDIDAR